MGGAHLTVAGVNFRNGDAGTNDGGAIFDESGTLAINGGTFTGKKAAALHAHGGAVDAEGALTVKGATFTGNTGYYGGAIATGAPAPVTGATFTGPMTVPRQPGGNGA